jgi:hypothetical protein
MSNGNQLGDPLIKKKVDGTPPVFRQRFEILKDFGGIGTAKLRIDGKTQGE